MARGQILTIPTGTSRLVTTQTRTERQALGLLNPNDGVCYLALDRDAGNAPSAWDWKLPSQSYGLFPGPWTSLGLYYVDQSGAARPGELNLYDSDVRLEIPLINSIGRAQQAFTSSMDIGQGGAPSNPPAGFTRLWADVNGVVHNLEASGSDAAFIDSLSALGGVLGGTMPNPLMAAGAASANVGALGGVLGGGLPNPSFAAGAVLGALSPNLITTAQMAPNSVTKLLYSADVSSDLWTNSGLGVGDNNLPGFPVLVNIDVGTAYIIGVLHASAFFNSGAFNTTVGWDFACQNVRFRKLNRIAVTSGVAQQVSVSTAFYIPASAWGFGSGGRQFGPMFYAANAMGNSWYLRCGSVPDQDFVHIDLIEVFE